MFAFAVSQSAPNPFVRPIPRYTQSPAVSFRLTGSTSLRPKGMYIDMNAGKGCHTCGGK